MRILKLRRRVFLALCTLVLATFMVPSAWSQYSATSPGPILSQAGQGSPLNEFYTGTYLGPASIFNLITFNGDLTEVNTATWASEARWLVTNQSLGGAIAYQPSTVGNFTFTISINKSLSALVFLNPGDALRFDAYESVNDSGVDASWANLDHTFSGTPIITSLGYYAPGTSFVLDTESSNFDTELALYSSAGTLLFSDDDSGTGTLSSINAGTLSNGTYYLVGGGYNSGFTHGFAFPGSAAGTLNMRINGSTISSGSLAANSFRVLTFTVGIVAVPEPATTGLIAVISIVAWIGFRRGRSKCRSVVPKSECGLSRC